MRKGYRREAGSEGSAKSISINGARRRSGGCAPKAIELTPGDLPRVASGRLRRPRGRLTAGQKSAEGIVCAGQRPDREGSSPSGARMRSAVSKGGGNASLAEARGRYGAA